MEDHDLLIRIDQKLSQLKDGDAGDIPDLKRQIQGIDLRLDCHDRKITRAETYLKVIGTGLTIAAGSIIKLFLGK